MTTGVDTAPYLGGSHNKTVSHVGNEAINMDPQVSTKTKKKRRIYEPDIK